MGTCYFHILIIALLVYQSSSFEQVLDSVMTLTWSISTDEIEIGVYCKVTLGYCALGLSNSMTNTDMMVFSTDGSIVSISDNYSYRHETPSTDLDLGGTDDLKYISGGLDQLNHINITISRKLNTGDQYDQVITPDIASEICWSYKDGSVGLTKHSDKNSATFTWAALTETNDLETINFNLREHDHGTYLSISWALLAPIGIISARYFNHTAWWIYVHISTLITASILTIYAVTDLYNLDKRIYNELSENRFFHSRFGMMITSLVISQVFFGILTSYFKIFTKNLHAVTIITRFHRVIGFALLIAGVGNCLKGWIIHGGRGLTAFIVGFILFCLVMVFFESWQVFYKNQFKGRSEKLKEMDHFEAFELNKTGKKLMFADDMVIDVSHFMLAHPGGAYMIQNSIGEDTGKYMVGCSSYGGALNPYQHSNKAFSIVKSLAIAKIPYPQGYLISQDSTVDNASMEFHVVEKLALNEHTSVIYLKSDYFKMASTCEQISWLGKHFKGSYRNRFTIVNRYYSAIFIDLNEWGIELGIISDQAKFHEIGLVKLIFKVYVGGKMTSYLNGLRKGEHITMQGPIGPGLMIHELTGNCLAFAGGTGLVAFLDLVYLASKNENLSTFYLTLFVSFKTVQDGFALEVLEAVKKRPNANWLNLIIMTDQHPDKKRIPELVKEMLQSPIKIAWICGPSGFNRYYSDLLIQSGLASEKIIMM